MHRISLSILVALAVASTLSAQLVTPRGGAPQLVIPAAGAVQGANGTFFHSDITLINYRFDASQNVQLQWLPQNASGGGIQPVEIIIPAATGISSEDFVTQYLHQTGLGAILVTAITPAGALDVSGRIYATSRIWSPEVGTSGTTSQTFPAIATSDMSSARQTIIGQRRDDRYRLNIGVVNIDASQTQSYAIAIRRTDATEAQVVTLPPLSMTQVSAPGPASTVIQIAVTNASQGAQLPFVTYGSSVDNVTGDGWSSLGFVSAADQSAP